MGIINARNILILNCTISSALQTNVAMVNDTKQFYNRNIQFINCVFKDSHQHNVRIISYNKGEMIGNTVSFKYCKFRNVRGRDTLQKEIKNQKLHIWYRGVENANTETIKLQLEDCDFDTTGNLFVNGSNTNLVIKNSFVGGALNIKLNIRMGVPNIQIYNTSFLKQGDFRDYFKEKEVLNQVKKLKNPYTETFFGSVYPSTILKYIKINTLD